MTARADATLAAIVRELVPCLVFGPHHPFRPAEIAPRIDGKWLTGETVARHLRRAAFATPGRTRDGYWRLTPAGMAAVEAARKTSTPD